MVKLQLFICLSFFVNFLNFSRSFHSNGNATKKLKRVGFQNKEWSEDVFTLLDKFHLTGVTHKKDLTG
jgi:hypothetical protein